MKTVAIVGVGLIGGSFGLALRRSGFDGSILGVSSARSIDEALERGAINRGATLEEAAGLADLIFLAQPVLGIIETLGKLDALVRPEALVTDVGSTKQAIVDAASRCLIRCAFVGGHPMAGKEQRGAAAADARLFEGRPWILTREHSEFRQWITTFGARPMVLDAATHDRLVAWASHLPQLASTALAAVLCDHEPGAASIAGPGLLDMTRLAMGSFDLWSDILETNQAAVAGALDAYIARLQGLRGNIESEFSKASEFARELRKRA